MGDRTEEREYYLTHCASCGKKNPPRFTIHCGECFHPYLTNKIGLVIHDFLIRVRLEWEIHKHPLFDDDRKFNWRWLLPRRPSKIFVCPCCDHDL
jgi:hypothetical protein